MDAPTHQWRYFFPDRDTAYFESAPGDSDFYLVEKPAGSPVAAYLWIDNCGGQADSHPRSMQQMKWLEQQLNHRPDVTVTWPTTWDLLTTEAVQHLKDALAALGAVPV